MKETYNCDSLEERENSSFYVSEGNEPEQTLNCDTLDESFNHSL